MVLLSRPRVFAPHSHGPPSSSPASIRSQTKDKPLSSIHGRKRHDGRRGQCLLEWHHCPHEERAYKSKHKGNLRQHSADIHNVGVVWHQCQHEECAYKSKRKSILLQHLASIHNEGVVWQHCKVGDCTYKAKENGNLKIHQALVHGIGVRWYKCIVLGCKYKLKSDVTRHIASIHGIGTRWFACPEQGCGYKAKERGSVKRHVNRMHPDSTARERPIQEVFPEDDEWTNTA